MVADRCDTAVLITNNSNGQRKGHSTPHTPPHDLRAEESLLGAMLLRRDAIVAAVEVQLSADDFYKPAHRHIYDAITSLYAQGDPADPVTVAEFLSRAGVLDAIGGPAILIGLQAGTPSIGNARKYAEIVLGKSQCRLLALAAENARDAALAERDVGPALAAMSKIVDAAGGGATRPATEGAGELAEDFHTMAQLVKAVEETEPCGWLCRPIWPADAYGVLAAEKKAGKTWAILDLVVSVASGSAWLGVYPVERPGPVLVFLGEGGKRKMLRRLRAVCEARGVEVEDLHGVVTNFRPPHLTDQEALAVVSEKLAELSPVLMVIDPLYLAARGAKSSSLFDMGTHLSNIQAIAQNHGTALVIAHHWNQTGKGGGADRMSGAGPAEWGRVLASLEVEHRQTDPETKATAVTLGFSFIGDEIPDTELRICRRVWATNPEDLNSPLHYEVDVLEGKRPTESAKQGMSPATARVLAVLRASAGGLTVREIGDALAVDATGVGPLQKRTIQDSVKKLGEAGLTVSEAGDSAPLWSACATVPEKD